MKTIETRIVILGPDAVGSLSCRECGDPDEVIYGWTTEDDDEHLAFYCLDCAKALGIIGEAVRP